MKHFKQFHISTSPQSNEIISGLLWQLDLAGINETDFGLLVFAESLKNISKNDISKILYNAVQNNLIEKYEISEEEVEDKNWNEEYEKNVRVNEITDRLVIKPSFKDYTPEKNQIVITIDPKMSFGTSEHQTTRLMLTLIEKHVRQDDIVLDVGSGTGILAIASVLLGADKAIGIDNDEWCLLNGKENVKMNGLEDKVDIRLAELNQITEKEFDLVVANINKHILIEIAEELKSKIKMTGTLILSGLLISDEGEICNKYTSLNLKPIEKLQMDEWLALVFQ